MEAECGKGGAELRTEERRGGGAMAASGRKEVGGGVTDSFN